MQQTVGVAGGETLIDLVLHEAQLLYVVAGVETLAARGALGRDDTVALLPAAQGRRGAAEHLCDRPDAVERPIPRHVRTSIRGSCRTSPQIAQIPPKLRGLFHLISMQNLGGVVSRCRESADDADPCRTDHVELGCRRRIRV